MGAFGMKIPKEYGGLGFTQREYAEVIKLISSWDGNLIALLSAHQSIGVPQPLKLFGTKEQKAKYFPRLARGAVSAFALTEADVGSDPANLSTMAARTPEGDYVLNGEKLWCTNGTIAELFVVMARHPDTKKISAFIVEKDWPGVEVVLRCHFMGLKAIENGVIRFTERPRPEGEPALGGGAGPEARARDPEHRTADAPGDLRRERQAVPRDLPQVGERARAVGTAGRQARRDRADPGRDGGDGLRDGSRRGSRLRPRGQGGPRHPPGGRGREDVEHGRGVEDRGPHVAGPRRTRLRDGRFSEGARRAGHPGRAHDARLSDQPDLRRLFRDHAPLHRARGARPASVRRREPGRSEAAALEEALGAPPGRGLLRPVVRGAPGRAGPACRGSASSARSRGTSASSSAPRAGSPARSST